MFFRISILLLFVCFLLVGCSFAPDEMKIAEQILDTHPDSALVILQHLSPEKFNSNADKAFYRLLLLQALDRNDKPLPPDSLIEFSIRYFQSKNDNVHLARCYFYKGHIYKRAQHYDEATIFYLKALDCLQNNSSDVLLGKIYADMGDICSIQLNYQEAMKKYKLSLDRFNQAKSTIDANYILLYIGRTYHFLKNYSEAKKYYNYVLKHNTDSMICGAAYQEIGLNYCWLKQLDSAQYYLRKSLEYPYRGTNFSIRSYTLADLLFDKEQYDSSCLFALQALKHPANFYTQRECYRILVNVEYLRKDIKQMGKYMTQYQCCGDSIRKVESQTKCTVLENLHNTTQEATGAKRNMILIGSVLLIILLLSAGLVLYLFKRIKVKRELLNEFKLQLNRKQEIAGQRLSEKIEETRVLQSDLRKNATAVQRNRLDEELYNRILHLNDWDGFSKLMNRTFNNIVDTLNSEYPAITHKEISWCCMQLLDIPHVDRMLLLDATSDSLYKLKQRLAHKLNLKSTKDLDLFLKAISATHD